MKDVGFKSIEVVPFETVLDFTGQAQTSAEAETDLWASIDEERGSIALRGEARFSLSRPLKIRGMSIKFKGFSRTCFRGNEISVPLLPKLKQSLFGKTTLPAGEHSVPFMLEVPNIFPPSLNIKRANISYKLELSAAIGLQKKTITAEHPIELRRHLLRCKEMAPLVETQIYEDTIPAKFHYEIDAPQIVCLEQGSVPMCVKYLCFASQKPVRSIRTQLTQIELYRCQAPSKSSTDVKATISGCRALQTIADTLVTTSRTHRKCIKRTVPALIHAIDNNQQTSTWKRPLILRHKLQQLVTPALESPLVSIYHQLEITFQFEHQFENIKAKIPIVIASIPPPEKFPPLFMNNIMPSYHFEQNQSKQDDSCISMVIEEPTQVEEGEPADDTESVQPGVYYSILGEPHEPLPVTSSSINLLQHSKEDDQAQKADDTGRSIRKFASADELRSISKQSDGEDNENNDRRLPFERPRTTTPIMQRRRGVKKDLLTPIDVDLANGLKPPNQRMAKKPYCQSRDMATVDKNLVKSKARLQQARKDRQKISKPEDPITNPVQLKPIANVHSGTWASIWRSTMNTSATRVAASSRTAVAANEYIASNGTGNISSRPSSKFAESLASSTTNSTNSNNNNTNDDQQSYFTRPPSPVQSVAPGLPSAILLRPQNDVEISRVEESFVVDITPSPTVGTIASSTLLSPRTLCSVRRSRRSSTGIPLSAVMSSHYRLPSQSSGSCNSSLRESTMLDPDCELLRRLYAANLPPPPPLPPMRPPPPQSSLPPIPRKPPAANSSNNPYRYLKLPPLPPTSELPPIPTAAGPPPVTDMEPIRPRRRTPSPENMTRRMTKLYVDDSDDEVLDPLPPIPADYEKRASSNYCNSLAESTLNILDDVPQLSPLSLGTAFNVSL